MSDRSTKLFCALLAGALAGVGLAAIAPSAARANDECLAAPKGASPEGSHWFYRIDHATKRHCWYLGPSEKQAHAAGHSSRSEKSSPPKKAESSTSRSIANAHAELPSSTSIEQAGQADNNAAVAPRKPAKTADSTQFASADSETRGSLVASRWPEMPAAGVPLSPPPALARLAANLPSDTAAASAPVLPAVSLAAADTPRETGSVAMLLAVMSGALTLAGVIASVVFKFGGVRRFLERGTGSQRPSLWDKTDDDEVRPFNVLSFAHAEEDGAWTDSDYDLDPVDRRHEHVSHFFRQLSDRVPG